MLSNATDDERLIQEGEAAVEHYTKDRSIPSFTGAQPPAVRRVDQHVWL
jgi:hypothetical protein